MQSLGAADGDLLGVRAEGAADRQALGRVVEHGRGAVGVDVVDRLRRQTGVGRAPRSWRARPGRRPGAAPSCGGRHSWSRSRALRRRCARRGARRAPTPPAPASSPPSAMTKPSRSRSKGRLAVAGSSLRAREHADDGEGAEGQRRQRRFDSAGQHRLGAAVADQAGRLADGDGAGGAGVGVGDRRAGQSELDGDVAGGGAAEDGERQQSGETARMPRSMKTPCCSSAKATPPSAEPV